MKHMNNKVLLYKHRFIFHCNLTRYSHGTVKKHVIKFIKATLTISAPEY